MDVIYRGMDFDTYTVPSDLISYKILQTEPLRLDEVVSGTGRLTYAGS